MSVPLKLPNKQSVVQSQFEDDIINSLKSPNLGSMGFLIADPDMLKNANTTECRYKFGNKLSNGSGQYILLEFDNFSGVKTFTMPHNLKRTPQFFNVVQQSEVTGTGEASFIPARGNMVQRVFENVWSSSEFSFKYSNPDGDGNGNKYRAIIVLY